MSTLRLVIAAKAGTRFSAGGSFPASCRNRSRFADAWAPAFAGVTAG